MRRLPLLILLGPLSVLAASSGYEAGNTVETDSEIFTMKQVYKSMFGPSDNDTLTLLSTDAPEVLWITAIKAEIVGADGESPESPEYFCHSTFINRLSQSDNRQKILGPRLGRTRKMFTLVQGLTEVRFPKGFGMPVLSNDQFTSHVMVMNPSERDEPVRVGVDSRIEYVRESELDQKMKPLFLLPLVTEVTVRDLPDPLAHVVDGFGQNADHTSHEHEGDLSCLSADADTTSATIVDSVGYSGFDALTLSESGLVRTGHWNIPPGRHVYRHRLERMVERIPFDTRAHYIFAHLHPFGESLELIDLTTGESVFKAIASNYSDQVAVEKITHYSSEEGLPIFRHHDYEIVAIYNNTTRHEIDSMAVMYLYLRDSNRAVRSSKNGT